MTLDILYNSKFKKKGELDSKKVNLTLQGKLEPFSRNSPKRRTIMLKKKLVTIVAAAFCVALVTAQSSAVNKVTTGLIEDGAIDSFK